MAVGNYAGNALVFDPESPRPLVSAMPDGTSNTVMLAHKLQICNGNNLGYNSFTTYWEGDLDSAWWQNIPGFGFPSLNRRYSWIYLDCGNNYTSHGTANDQYGCWFMAGETTQYVFGGLPFQIQPAPGYCDPQLTVSPHTAVMLVALGDASVRPVPSSITTNTWLNACIPDDGNVLGSDW